MKFCVSPSNCENWDLFGSGKCCYPLSVIVHEVAYFKSMSTNTLKQRDFTMNLHFLFPVTQAIRGSWMTQ